MKKAVTFATTLTLVLLLASPLLAWESSDRHKYQYGHCNFDHLSMDFDEGTLIFDFGSRHGDIVEITEDYQLYINGELIPTDEEQQKQLRECYHLADRLTTEAVRIGLEGARIGIDGARIGFRAMGGVLKMLFTDYDEDDLERDMERHTRRLERRAERLEKKAERIETMAEKLELAYERLERDIPELQEIN
jgi:hypothetical protein